MSVRQATRTAGLNKTLTANLGFPHITAFAVFGDHRRGIGVDDRRDVRTTGDKMIGPFPSQIFADPTTGLCTITPTATTNVTYGAFKLQAP